MAPRVRLVVIGFFACAFAALAGIWIAALTKEDGGTTALASTGGYVRADGVPVPDFALRNQDGKVTRPPKGEVAVYAFIYSHCEDTCPFEVQQIRAALDDLGRDVPVYGISVDPANDTPLSAKAFMTKQHMTGRMQFLLGSEDELAPVWKAFATSPQEDGKEHSAGIVVADAEGFQRTFFPGTELTPEGLLADLRKLGG